MSKARASAEATGPATAGAKAGATAGATALPSEHAPSPPELIQLIDRGDDLDRWWPVHTERHAQDGTDPAEEVAIGAVLVQNTSWTQVERAIGRLAAEGPLSLAHIASLDDDALVEILRPAGFIQRKPATLRALGTVWAEAGGSVKARAGVADDPDPFREELLSVHGIGPETADAILLYGFGAPVFVVDAYTRRLMDRIGVHIETPRGSRNPHQATYPEVAAWWRRSLGHDAGTYQRTHAVIVEHMKTLCRKVPRCNSCPARQRCATGRATAANAAAPQG